MTFNILGEPLCDPNRNHKADMLQITNFITTNNIKLAALQEAKKVETDDCDFNLPEILDDQLNSPYIVSKRQYLGSNDNKWYRIFVHDTPTPAGFPIVEYPSGVTWVQDSDSHGFEAIVLDTAVGRIRFINLHAHGSPILADNIIKFVNQFRSDGIPMILMGDFNLLYTDTTHIHQSIHGEILARILQAGFYRACDPLKFPNGNCNDTVKGIDGNYAIDHILIDTRAKFFVKNAYVEQSMRFSDHLPVVVELVKDTCPRKHEGDADCDGDIDLNDAVCWVEEVRQALNLKPTKPVNCKSADFNGNGEVSTRDLAEISIWRSSFIKANTNQ